MSWYLTGCGVICTDFSRWYWGYCVEYIADNQTQEISMVDKKTTWNEVLRRRHLAIAS